MNEEDPSRPYTVSSPSNGKQSEQDGYISMNPGSSEYGDGRSIGYIKHLIVCLSFFCFFFSSLLQLRWRHVELGILSKTSHGVISILFSSKPMSF